VERGTAADAGHDTAAGSADTSHAARHRAGHAPGEYRFGLSSDAEGRRYVSHGGVRWLAQAVPALRHLAAVAGSATVAGGKVQASLPGIVTAVNVEVGQDVAQGDVVVVMEAMKLIFSLPAARAGRVSAVHCTVGQTVGNAQLLVEIEPVETPA
jgi:3-methylcrotonyl-CoA carboxylase alpha subunit